MRTPRVRFTTGSLMAAVALVALAFPFYEMIVAVVQIYVYGRGQPATVLAAVMALPTAAGLVAVLVAGTGARRNQDD